MANQEMTLPATRHGPPIRSLRVEVIAGPNTGQIHDGATETVTIGTAADNTLVLTDETVSRYHVELRAEGDRIYVADQGSTNKTTVGAACIERGTVARGATLVLGNTHLRITDGAEVKVDVFDSDNFHGLRGKSLLMQKLMARLKQLAATNVSVLILGETGTGKEVVAKSLHLGSSRASGPLEIVDCGALMPTLVASELFGHEKGAFTGANQRYIGAFERAHGGTIFLDEIGELTAELQVRLLGVLERRTFRRVGGTKPIEVDVRVLAATHRDLREWVNRGDFRQDLYYRIAVARVEIPPLRRRADDISLLAEHFLEQMEANAPLHQVLSYDTMLAMARYHWPGNIRELRNFIESAVALGDADVELGPSVTTDDATSSWSKYANHPYREARELAIRDFQVGYLSRVLKANNGSTTRAAEAAQMNRPHLIQILKKLNLR